MSTTLPTRFWKSNITSIAVTTRIAHSWVHLTAPYYDWHASDRPVPDPVAVVVRFIILSPSIVSEYEFMYSYRSFPVWRYVVWHQEHLGHIWRVLLNWVRVQCLYDHDTPFRLHFRPLNTFYFPVCKLLFQLEDFPFLLLFVRIECFLRELTLTLVDVSGNWHFRQLGADVCHTDWRQLYQLVDYHCKYKKKRNV